MNDAVSIELAYLLSLEANAPIWMQSYIHRSWTFLNCQRIREKVLRDEFFPVHSDFESMLLGPLATKLNEVTEVA